MAITVVPQVSHAQSSAKLPLVIATVNVPSILANAAAGKAFNVELLKFQEQINVELQQEGNALRVASDELNRKRALLAPEVFDTERKKHQQNVSRFQNKRQNSQKLMNQKVIEAKGLLNQKIIEIITRYATTNKVTLILPVSNVVLSADTYNISKTVLATLNKELPALNIQIPAK